MHEAGKKVYLGAHLKEFRFGTVKSRVWMLFLKFDSLIAMDYLGDLLILVRFPVAKHFDA